MNEAKEIGTGIVRCVRELGELVRRARALPGDGTRVAGYIARELLAQGAHLADGSAHPLRWALTETPIPKEDPTGLAAAHVLASLLGAALRRTDGGPDSVLAEASRHWTEHDTKADAERAAATAGRARTDVVVREAAAAHAKRLADKPVPRGGIIDVDEGAWEDGERVFGGGELVPTVG